MNNVLRKVFKKNGQKIKIPDEAKTAPAPRAKDLINAEYQQVCVALGDRAVKKQGLENDIANLFRRVEQLGNELEAREKLDAESKPESPAEPAQGASEVND